MPPHSMASLDLKMFSNHDKVCDELDWLTLDKVHEKAKKASDDDEFSLSHRRHGLVYHRCVAGARVC